MGANRTSGESDRIDGDRRRALALLGLWCAAALLAPALIISRPAKAQGDGGDDDDDDDDHGDDDDDDHGDDDDSGFVKLPEAPYQERRRGSRKARRERRWR